MNLGPLTSAFVNPNNEDKTGTIGVLYGLAAFGIWGLFPLYWKQLLHVSSLEILAHRMVWSLAFILVILAVKRRWSWLRALRNDFRTILIYFVAASTLAVNWGVYIWAVNAGFVVETALGYFINPLFNVVFGAIFLSERPRPIQWFAIGLAACGVLYLAFVYGQPPWIALTLALSFATYGLLKKKAKLGALEGLSLETGLLFLPALAFLIWSEIDHGGAFGRVDLQTNVLLMGAGIATALPLLFFAAALRRLTLTAIGILQYLAPSIQFLLGVYIYNEALSTERLIGFVLIWVAVGTYTLESLVRRRLLKSEAKLAASLPES